MKYLADFVMAILMSVATAFVAHCYWGWFAVPICDAPQVSLLQIFAAQLVWGVWLMPFRTGAVKAQLKLDGIEKAMKTIMERGNEVNPTAPPMVFQKQTPDWVMYAAVTFFVCPLMLGMGKVYSLILT